MVAYNNYYPFGMPMPGRNSFYNYRYGFQGQEKDDELKGEGNSLNYKFRMHDPRVGRFFAVDPLTAKYSHYTPYSFSGNKLISHIELEGLEEFNIITNRDWNFRRYKIQKGDNLTAISKSTGVALENILKWNPGIKDKDIIHPNEIIDLVDARGLPKEHLINRPIVQKSGKDKFYDYLKAVGKGLITTDENGMAVQDQALFVASFIPATRGFGLVKNTLFTGLFTGGANFFGQLATNNFQINENIDFADVGISGMFGGAGSNLLESSVEFRMGPNGVKVGIEDSKSIIINFTTNSLGGKFGGKIDSQFTGLKELTPVFGEFIGTFGAGTAVEAGENLLGDEIDRLTKVK